MGVSEDEASWVVTTYLVANAIILTASSFLAQRLGRKTLLPDLPGAVHRRARCCAALPGTCNRCCCSASCRGFGGGGMVPVAQSILADSFPPEKRGQAFALFGVAVVVAPVVGPTLGGWLSDNFSWHWCFLINGPVGVLAIALIALLLRESEDRGRGAQRCSSKGAGSISSASCWSRPSSARSRSCSTAASRTTGSAQPSSSTFAVVCALAFVLMIPWELSRRNPMIDLRMVATRQFGACFLVMLATGAILLATTQFLPQLVQQNFGYTATWAGLVLSPGGLVTMVMMFVVGRLSGKVQPKYLIVAGAAIIARSRCTS